MKLRLACAVIVLSVFGTIFALHYHKALSPRVAIPLTGTAKGLEFSPDGKTLSVCTDSGVVLYDTAQWKPGLSLKGHTDFGYWMSDARLLTFGAFGVGSGTPKFHICTEMTVWNTEMGSVLHRTTFPAYEVVALSPDFKMAALRPEGRVKIVSTETGLSLHEFPGPPFFEPQFSPDGRYFANVASEVYMKEPAPVHVWDTRTWREVSGPPVEGIRVCCLCFSPDGKILATGTPDAVTLWDTKTWRAVRTFPAQFKYLIRLRFSPDGTHLAGGGRSRQETTSENFFWTLWNMHDGKPVAEVHNAYFWNFLPQSEVAVTNDLSVTRLWNGASGKLLWSSVDRVPHVDKWMEGTSVALSPDNNTLATATYYLPAEGTLPGEIGHPPNALQIWNMPQR